MPVRIQGGAPVCSPGFASLVYDKYCLFFLVNVSIDIYCSWESSYTFQWICLKIPPNCGFIPILTIFFLCGCHREMMECNGTTSRGRNGVSLFPWNYLKMTEISRFVNCCNWSRMPILVGCTLNIPSLYP